MGVISLPNKAPQNLTTSTKQPGSDPSTKQREKRKGGEAFTKARKKADCFFSTM